MFVQELPGLLQASLRGHSGISVGHSGLMATAGDGVVSPGPDAYGANPSRVPSAVATTTLLGVARGPSTIFHLALVQRDRPEAASTARRRLLVAT